MKIGIDMGHNIPGIDTGASCILNEDKCTKEIGNIVIENLRSMGHEVINCSPSRASSLSDSLNQRCNIANNNNVEIFASIHLNAGGGSGVEVWGYSNQTDVQARRICNNISSALGIPNRGVKYNQGYAVLNGTTMPAMIIECMFTDSSTDASKYNAQKIAKSIAEGLTGQELKIQEVSPVSPKLIKVQCGAFSNEDNADKLIQKLKLAGFNAIKVKE